MRLLQNLRNMPKNSIVPVNDWLLVEQFQEELKTSLIIPDDIQDEFKRAFGTVLAIGSKAEIDVEVGDTIYFNDYAGERVEADGKECLFLKPHDVIAKTALHVD